VKQARQDYRAEVAALPVGYLHFIDESGINLGLTRRYGRAAPGIRVEDAVPFNPGPNVSIIGALSCRGIGAVMSIEGATDGPVFLAYVRQVLAPTFPPTAALTRAWTFPPCNSEPNPCWSMRLRGG
jgi:hypothetical protein